MMQPDTGALSMPAFARRILLPAAGLPLGPLLTLSLRSLARRRPELFERLGEHSNARFLIDPVDLPFAFIVSPNGTMAAVYVTTGSRPELSDVVIRGPIMTLLGVLDGSLDGDALFFHRAISISGRTEAVVALRNAIEDAELQPSDLLGLRGAAARFADDAIFGSLDVARRFVASGAHRQKERA